MNIISRMFAYPILERELCNRLADKDAEILRLSIEVQELRDRLFLRHGMVPSGEKVTSQVGQPLPPYRTGRRRLRDMVTPAVSVLSEEDQATIDATLTQ